MFGTLIGSGIAACLIYASYKSDWRLLDKNTRIMLKVFENIDFKAKDEYPRFFKKSVQEKYIDYIFNVPYGLTDDEKELQPILEKTLMKPVRVSFKGKLFIRVYYEELPKKVECDWKPSEKWTVPIGYSLDGLIYHNFDHIPHMTVAGMTRQGKTFFLKLVLTHLALNNSDVTFYIIDLKERLEFGDFERYKQVKKVVGTTNEASEMLDEVLSNLNSELKKGIKNVVGVHEKRTFIIVDEAAELDDKCQEKLSRIARIGGALGYRLIYATQYPTADTLPRQIKQNSDAKVSFRLPTKVASRVAIDENGAEELICPGRAIYRTHERVEVQVPFIDDEEIKKRLRRFEVDKRKNQTTRTNTIKLV